MQEYIVRIVCTDEKGLVHKITGELFKADLNVNRTDEFVEPETDLFFMRASFTGEANLETLKSKIQHILPEASQIDILPKQSKKVILLATKEHHCLTDIIIRNNFEDLPFEIEAVISNYEVLQPFVAKFNIPFFHIPAISTEPLDRLAHEHMLSKIIDSMDFDFIILAKYMRVLTPQFTEKYTGKLINIHHSFLPAFIGANPYKQAYQRGVKIIGATAHFVTDDLDEGPIICQEIVHVNHSNTVADMVAAGREVEKLVLAKALKLVFEDRVFVSGNKTIIFE